MIGRTVFPLLCLAACAGHAVGQTAPVSQQPAGALSGKIVYLHGGHGWTADNLGAGAWFTQRPETFEIVEDFLNQDLLRFQADSLWRVGATVVPLRPIGHQPHETVLDNDDPGVTFSGSWSNSSSPIFFGSPGDLPYRFASTAPVETAFARYRPDLPEAGFYPVYAWTRHGLDRVEQLYRVAHTGGVTEVRVDHTRVGNGLVYLGTYRFEAGTDGYVDISNESDEPGVVIADMIRFGNGMGDTDRGAGPSGAPREDEAALYWIETHAGVGIPSSAWRSSSDDGTATISAPTRWAAQMNREAGGALADRVFLSHHSNAFDGTARGVIALVNGNNNPATATPNQFLLALTLAGEINDDMVSLDGTFEHDWADRSVLTLDAGSFEYGEINNLLINDEFDATIVERAFHDNQLDAELLRDPKVNEAIARATTQGLIRYFNAVDGGQTSVAFPPSRPSGVSATKNGDGSVTLRWNTPPGGPALGGGASAYRVEASTDGYGFDGGAEVNALFGTTFTLAGYGPGATPRYFRVVAVNSAGESPPSAVVAATPGDAPSRVLIVDGFDRNDRFQNVREPYFGGRVDRVRERSQNSRDYVVQAADAIAATGLSLAFDSTDNGRVIAGDVALTDYDAVVWILGEESSVEETFNPTEQSLVAAYLAQGGDLFVSGAEIGWDLDFLNNGPAFYSQTLRAGYVRDDAFTYSVEGATGSIFEGLALSFDDGSVFYDAEFCDVIEPANGSSLAMTYSGGFGGGAAIQHRGTGGGGDLVMLAFPFETILDPQDRADVIDAALRFFGFSEPAPCFADVTTDGSPNGVPDGAVTLSDFSFYLSLWSAADPAADLTTDGACTPLLGGGDGVTLSDFSCYLALWSAGCH